MNSSQRAMIAAEIYEAGRRERERLRAIRREKNKAIRAATPKLAREDCFVCLKFKPITQQHHVVPVRCSEPGDVGATETVWLCPNCHAVAHALSNKSLDELKPLLSDDQWSRMASLMFSACHIVHAKRKRKG